MPLRRAMQRAAIGALSGALCGFDYGVSVVLRDEADVMALAAETGLDDDLRDQLLGLLREPLDLNRASAEELARLPDVSFAMAEAIVARRQAAPFTRPSQLAAVVGPAVYARSRAMVTVEPVGPGHPLRWNLSGRLASPLDPDATPMGVLRADVRKKGLRVALVAGVEEAPYGVVWSDPIQIEGERARPALEHAGIERDGPIVSVWIGDFMVGFSARLTLDVSDQARPDGPRLDLRLNEDSEDQDSYSVPLGLRGVAVQADAPVGDTAGLRATMFASSKQHDLYYTMFEPHDWVSAYPDVAWPTFDAVWREDLAGGRLGLVAAGRAEVGLVGWIARAVPASEIDFTGTPIPNRARYGAMGIHGRWWRERVELRGEAARMDSGGLAARVEGRYEGDTLELEPAFRAYGAGYDNPHSRATADADTLARHEEDGVIVPGGDRDRDELGPQLALRWAPVSALAVSGHLDLWRRPTLETTRGSADLRVSVDPLPVLGLDLRGGVRSRDLGANGEDLDYDADDPIDEHGSRGTVAGALRLTPLEALTVQLEHSRALEQDGDRGPILTVGSAARADLDLGERFSVSGRARLGDERPGDPRGEHTLGAWAELACAPTPGLGLAARYAQLRELDETDDVERSARLTVTWRGRRGGV